MTSFAFSIRPTAPSHSSLNRRPWQRADATAPLRLQTAPLPGPFSPRPHRNDPGFSLFESLRGLDLFSHLPDGDLLKLAAVARERRVDKGDTLMLQHDEAKHLFILLQGKADVTCENGEGGEVLLATLQAGDMAGEISLFDGSPQPASIRAVQPSRILALHRDEMFRCLREKPELAFGLLREMARRLRLCQRRIAGICCQRAPRRVASTLLALLEERGTRLKDGEGRLCLSLRQRPTQRCIAELAGTTRETVSRHLARWERLGWLRDAGGDLLIYDEPRLKQLAGE